jgi:hypothetical protein
MPLKRQTPICTCVGAFSGAMPALIGCVAAARKLNFSAWLLRDSFPLGIPAFHGDCVYVSRGLRTGRLPGSSAGARKIQTCGMAERTPGACVNSNHCCVANPAASEPGTRGGNAAAQFLYFAARLAGIGSNAKTSTNKSAIFFFPTRHLSPFLGCLPSCRAAATANTISNCPNSPQLQACCHSLRSLGRKN